MSKPTKHTRAIIWERFLRAVANERYYQAFSDKYQRWYKWMLYFLAGAAIFGVIPFIVEDLSSSIKIASNLIIAAASIFGLVQNLPEKSGKLKSIFVRYSSLKSEYEILWVRLENGDLDNAEALAVFKELDAKESQINETVQISHIEHDEKLDEKSTKMADDFTIKQYQTNLEEA